MGKIPLANLPLRLNRVFLWIGVPFTIAVVLPVLIVICKDELGVFWYLFIVLSGGFGLLLVFLATAIAAVVKNRSDDWVRMSLLVVVKFFIHMLTAGVIFSMVYLPIDFLQSMVIEFPEPLGKLMAFINYGIDGINKVLFFVFTLKELAIATKQVFSSAPKGWGVLQMPTFLQA